MDQKRLDTATLRRSLKNLRLEGSRISVNLPLLENLYALNASIKQRLPAYWGIGLGQMGLLLNRSLTNFDYWCTPINSLSFGETGGDGAHFSFVVTQNTIDASTPVIITVPDIIGEQADANIVLGRGLEDFIRLGLHCGYFSMSLFAFNLADNLRHYARSDWDDGEHSYLSQNHQIVAQEAAKFFNLTPLSYTAEEFHRLQADFAPLLKYKPLE